MRPYLTRLYEALSDNPDLIDQGFAAEKGVTDTDVDPDQLALGIEIEKEHTGDEEVARQIALDHLAEIPDYYTRLDAMEKDAKGEDHGGEGEGDSEEPSDTVDVDVTAVADFLRGNPNPSDEEFHEWAEKMGYDVHAAEAAVYKLASQALGSAGSKGEKEMETKRLSLEQDQTIEEALDMIQEKDPDFPDLKLKKGRFTEWCKRNGFKGPSLACVKKAMDSDDESVRGMASFYRNTVLKKKRKMGKV